MLESVYDFPRARIATTVRRLLDAEEFAFMNRAAVDQALERYRSSSSDPFRISPTSKANTPPRREMAAVLWSAPRTSAFHTGTPAYVRRRRGQIHIASPDAIPRSVLFHVQRLRQVRETGHDDRQEDADAGAYGDDPRTC